MNLTSSVVAAIRFFKACIKANNHFLHRHLMKNDLLLTLIELLEVEGPRDNMLCSSCLDVFELIRKVSDWPSFMFTKYVPDAPASSQENVKPVINHLFEKHEAKLLKLSSLPNLRAVLNALRTRWEQNNEPPPAEVASQPEETR